MILSVYIMSVGLSSNESNAALSPSYTYPYFFIIRLRIHRYAVINKLTLYINVLHYTN